MTTSPQTPDKEHHLLFILLKVARPEDQARLAAAVQQHIDTWIRHCAGYVSTRLHLGTDGLFLINRAEWVDEEHYVTQFLEDPRKKELDRSIAEFATEAPQPFPCRAF
ncbi:hypothetical protein [Streptomyces platensis]|uniref:hypothetical protein n=1 Tax=Streptomyces platensis TaxID=58346 RepID=UPI00386567BB|nr:hypothetical protein OG962_05930 [Streptomyces platensis]